MSGSPTTFGVPYFHADQLVQVNPTNSPAKYHGIVYVVTAHARGKLHVQALTDPTQTLSGSDRGFIGTDHSAWIGSRNVGELYASRVEAPDLAVGMVVKVPRDNKLWVITGETNGKYRAFPLGGSTDGRYLRGINPAVATIIPLADLASHL
jgi:hypothetical protein